MHKVIFKNDGWLKLTVVEQISKALHKSSFSERKDYQLQNP